MWPDLSSFYNTVASWMKGSPKEVQQRINELFLRAVSSNNAQMMVLHAVESNYCSEYLPLLEQLAVQYHVFSRIADFNSLN
jgi:hypothetical protein